MSYEMEFWDDLCRLMWMSELKLVSVSEWRFARQAPGGGKRKRGFQSVVKLGRFALNHFTLSRLSSSFPVGGETVCF